MTRHSFSGRIPTDRLYCRETDMWVIYHDGQVRIGATDFGVHLAGEVIAFMAKPDGAEILRGKGMATIECHKTVLAVHAPISFRLTAGNVTAEEKPALINLAPYTEGWMACGQPFDWEAESALLCDASAYRQHVLSVDPEACFDDSSHF
jgi:glycine cleavage system H protein